MPSDIGRDYPARNSRVNLYCNHCESQLGIFENEWLRLTSSYARPKEKGIHFGTDIGSKTQVVPSSTSHKTAEGCTLSDVVCQRCSATVGQYCKVAPSVETQYLVGHYFYKLSRVLLKESLTFQPVDPIFGFSGDPQIVLNSHAPSLAPSSTWSRTPIPTIPALRRAYYANGVAPPSRLSRTPANIQDSQPESPSLSTWEDIPPFGDDSLDLPPFHDRGEGTCLEKQIEQDVHLDNVGQDMPPLDEIGEDANIVEEGPQDMPFISEDFQNLENESNFDGQLHPFRDQSAATTDQSGMQEGVLALRRIAEQDLKLSNVNETLESLRYEMQEIRSLLGGNKPGRLTGPKDPQASALSVEMKALRAENEAMKKILRSLPARLQQSDIQGSSRNCDSSRTPESTVSNILGKRKRGSDGQDGGMIFTDDSISDRFQTPDSPMDNTFEVVHLGREPLGQDRQEEDQPGDADPGDAPTASVWRGADDASVDGVDFSDDEDLQFDHGPEVGIQAASKGKERSSGRAAERQSLPADFVAEEQRYLISDSEDENFEPSVQNKRAFKHKRTRSAERRRVERVRRKTDSLWKKGVPGGGYENGDGWVEQKRHHSGRFGRKVEVGSAPAVYPRGINERLFKDGKQIPTTHKRLARELEYLGLSDWIEKDKSDALYRRTIRVARKHYAFHHGGISSKALCQGKYTKADLEKVGMWDDEMFEEINIGEESDLEKLDFPLDPALAKAVEGWKKEAAAAKHRRRVAKAKEAAAAGDETAATFLAGLEDAGAMTESVQLANEGVSNESVSARASNLHGLPNATNSMVLQNMFGLNPQKNWLDDYFNDATNGSKESTPSIASPGEQTETAHMISAANAVSEAARKIANIWPAEPIDLTTSHTLQELLAMLEIFEKRERNSFLHSLREYFAIDYETGARLTIKQQIALTDERLARYTTLFLHSKVVINGEKPAGSTFWPDSGPKKLKFSRDHGKITSMVQDIFFLQRYNKKRNLRQRQNEAKLNNTMNYPTTENMSHELLDQMAADDDSTMIPESTLSMKNEVEVEEEEGCEGGARISPQPVSAANKQAEETDTDESASTSPGPDPSTSNQMEEAEKTTSSHVPSRSLFADLRTTEDEANGMRTRSKTSQAHEQMTKPPSKPRSTNSDKENATPNPFSSTSSQEIVETESDPTMDEFIERPAPPVKSTYAGVVKRGRGRPRKSVPWNFKSAAEKDRVVKEAMEREEMMERRSSMGRMV